ncbi:hypothetical protein TNCV_2717061 [Trichonephila clavipes]|nr:hypothetical protein TNCV_2717061 [Trichonephila clavipes]
MHNTKTEQRYHSEIYLVDNMLYKDQTFKIPALCDVWMMKKSVASVAVIVGYNPCPPPRPRIKRGFGCILGVQQSMWRPYIAKVDLVYTGVASFEEALYQSSLGVLYQSSLGVLYQSSLGSCLYESPVGGIAVTQIWGTNLI